jgi:ABC-2 type transport system permease protein
MSSPTLPSSPPVPTAPRIRSLLAVELRDELLAIAREPATLFFSVAMPVAFFALLVSLWGGETSQTLAQLPVATTMLATFGTFGVVGVTLLTPGIGVAEDRERGWLTTKRLSATPLPVTLTGKVLAAVPYAVAVLLAMSATAALTHGLGLDAGTWSALLLVLVLGAVPFALLGLSVGFLTTPNAATAILQAIYLPSAIASGLWFPLEMLPDVVATIAPWLPTYHLAQLGLGVVEGQPVAGHVLALALSTMVAAGLATVAYRRLPS